MGRKNENWEEFFNNRLSHLAEVFGFQLTFVMLVAGFNALDGVHLVPRWRQGEVAFWVITSFMVMFLILGIAIALTVDAGLKSQSWRHRLLIAFGWIIEFGLTYALFFFVGEGP